MVHDVRPAPRAGCPARGWVSVGWARTDDRRVADQLVRELTASRYGRAADRVGTGRICPRCASTAHGRPLVRGLTGSTLPGVSIARTPGVTVVALAACAQVGVDVERLDRFVTPSVATVVLHPAERASTAAELATAWVRKEALLKASGDGLSVDPASVRLDDTLGSPAVVEWPGATARPDWVIDLQLAGDLRAAIAGSGIVGQGELTVRRAGPGGTPG